MKAKTLILTLLVFLVLGGCTNKTPEDIDINGIITNINLVENAVVGILVEGKLDENTNYDKAFIKIDKNTKIVNESDKSNIKAKDLVEGQVVKVIFEGPVAESYPVQAYAKAIYVVNK